MQSNTVQIGNKVGIVFLNYDEEGIYELLDSKNPDVLKNEISVDSPMGKAILGRSVGDMVTYKIDKNMNHIKIVEIVGNC